MKKLWIYFIIIIALTALGLYIDHPKTETLWPTGPKFFQKDVSLKQGLDLQGGSHLVYEADLSKLSKETNPDTAIDGAVTVLENRINGLGVAEPNIQKTNFGNKKAILIELPGIDDLDKAKELIGSTAKMEFKDEQGNVVIEGKDLVPNGAQVTFDQQSTSLNRAPSVSLTFTSEGKEKFAQATAANINKRIAIELDGQVISAPTVQGAITEGTAVITGDFDIESAKFLAIQLNAGALPVPISLIEERTVGASLGADSVKVSIMAGLIGLILIYLFMILYYKVPGFIAAIALTIYAIISLAIFKLFGIVLTLAGIAGFIIGIGTAIDANILIFERMKEELKEGKIMSVALREGFKRAWNSIRDGNLSHILVAIVLIWFGTGSVRGFAIVLILGVLVSMFTAISVSRVFLLLVANSRFQKLLKI